MVSISRDLSSTDLVCENVSIEAAEWRQSAAKYGVENVNSTAQIAEALTGRTTALDLHPFRPERFDTPVPSPEQELAGAR